MLRYIQQVFVFAVDKYYYICATVIKMRVTMIHIGKVIEKILRDQGRTVTWFARSLYCDRTNVYKIFQRESVDSEMLFRISRILGHDFFKYYSKELENTEEDI